MTPIWLTPDQIAQVAGLTQKHVCRMLRKGKWFGRYMRTFIQNGTVEVAFSTLPDHICEAFVMLDQMDLPFLPLDEESGRGDGE